MAYTVRALMGRMVSFDRSRRRSMEAPACTLSIGAGDESGMRMPSDVLEGTLRQPTVRSRAGAEHDDAAGDQNGGQDARPAEALVEDDAADQGAEDDAGFAQGGDRPQRPSRLRP